MDQVLKIALRHIETATGPLGGNLQSPDRHPERRNKPFNGVLMEDEGIGLHRMEEFQDTAVHGIKNERPWHRMAAYMLINRRTNSEIAMAAGVTPVTVSVLRAQRWFQELLATLANEEGEEVSSIIAGHAIEAVNKIVDVMNNPDTPSRTALAAAQILLEQNQGKPVQKNINNNKTRISVDPKEELDGIMQELATIRSK